MEVINTEFWYMPRKKPTFKPRDKNANSSRRPQGKFKAKRKGPKRDDGYKPKAKPARKLEDSPFAALAALKSPKKD